MTIGGQADRSFEFNAPAAVIIGGGVLDQLGAQLARLQARRVLLLVDPFIVQTGLASRITKRLEDDGVVVSLWDGVQPDPTDANVRSAVEAMKRDLCQAIVAVGGGSALDAAKAAAALFTNGEPLAAMEGVGKIQRPGVPVIAVPTTAGTGSEVTKVAVITDTDRDVKMLLLDRHMMPTVALVDYTLTLSMPPALTAHVGIDTLTHGIEAYVSRRATPMSDALALQCIRLAADNLEAAFHEPENSAARASMMLAATLGGMAFTNSSVALVHAMSRPIGALFHVPHGLSNAVLLPAVTRFSLTGAPDRYAEIARTMGCALETDTSEAAGLKLLDRLVALNAALDIPRLGACRGLTLDAFGAAKRRMAADAIASGSANHNPIVPSQDQIVALYEDAY